MGSYWNDGAKNCLYIRHLKLVPLNSSPQTRHLKLVTLNSSP